MVYVRCLFEGRQPPPRYRESRGVFPDDRERRSRETHAGFSLRPEMPRSVAVLETGWVRGVCGGSGRRSEGCVCTTVR